MATKKPDVSTRSSSKLPSYELFSRDTKAFVYGNQTRAVQRMLDFDYLCRKTEPSVVAMITPERGGFEKFFWGTKEITIPKVIPSPTDRAFAVVTRYLVVPSIRALIAYPVRILSSPPTTLPITPMIAAS